MPIPHWFNQGSLVLASNNKGKVVEFEHLFQQLNLPVEIIPQGKLDIEDAIEDDRMYIHSRIPIFGETLDDVVGVVFNQRILEESIEDHDTVTLESISHEVHMVSENLPVPNLIDQFVKRKTHLFIVFDSYGQTAGVVTLEDAIETLLGVEIVDEMDEVEDMQIFAKDRSKQFQDRIRVEKKKLEKAKIN
mgnify:CR=1 FL=1